MKLINRLLNKRPEVKDLNPTLGKDWVSFKLKNSDKLIKRVLQAKDNQEKILIYGDYDVDGVTSTYLFYDFFVDFLNISKELVDYKLPSRQGEGYGLGAKYINKARKENISLIITVDNGITSFEAAKEANKYDDIDLIITDHHEPKQKLPETTIINQHLGDYPFKYLAGVGVVFKLLTNFASHLKWSNSKKAKLINKYLPVVAVGTVADCVKLVGENRLLVKEGLKKLRDNKGPKSLRGFIKYLGLKEITSGYIGYQLAPRLNAPGRVSDPDIALKVLLEGGPVNYKKVDDINTKRKAKTKELKKKAEKNVYKFLKNTNNKNSKILICHIPGGLSSSGYTGLVAGELTNKYNKPSLVLIEVEKDGIYKGSLRNPSGLKGFSIAKMLEENDDILEAGGGHKSAGGLSVKKENLETLKDRFVDYANNNIKSSEIKSDVVFDTYLDTNELSKKSINVIDKLAPFGVGNPTPKFKVEALLNNVYKFGQQDQYTKLELTKNGKEFYGLIWDLDKTRIVCNKKDKTNKDRDKFDILKGLKGETVSLIGKLKEDNFNGGVQMFVDCVS